MDRNVYWLSTQPDVVNWKKSLDKPVGVITTYANLTGLASLPASAITATAVTTQQAGPDGADLATTVTITNTSVGHGRVPAPGRRPAGHRQRRAAVR